MLGGGKSHDIAIRTMKILKEEANVFGEGALRKKLEDQTGQLGLKEDFILLGVVDNPYPYYAQCSLYVYAGYFEGRSAAVEESQILRCAASAKLKQKRVQKWHLR